MMTLNGFSTSILTVSPRGLREINQYALPDSYVPQKDAQRFLDGELSAMRKFMGAK